MVRRDDRLLNTVVLSFTRQQHVEAISRKAVWAKKPAGASSDGSTLSEADD